jgi:HemY protein
MRTPDRRRTGADLGSLCLKQKLWGKAQRYLEQALSDAADPRMVREST